jgi:hypothetical protein
LSISTFLRNALPVRTVPRFGFKVGRSEFAYRTSSSAMEANEFTAMTSTSSINHHANRAIAGRTGCAPPKRARWHVVCKIRNINPVHLLTAELFSRLWPGGVRVRLARPAASFGSKGFVS